MATFDLFSAVKDGDTATVRSLLTSRRCRSHLNDRNEWGDTVLHLAAEAGNSDVCQMLIAGGASVTVRNNRGETCLHRAAVGGHTDCVTAIVERDNDPEAVNSQNDAGYTALHHAAKHGTIDLIQVLLRSGSDRMLENNAGETPYMVAHKYQQFEAERLLLNIEQQHADKAIQEMNTKPKKIIAAYSKALKSAHKPESRVRLVIVGDAKSGKTSLKKTLFGEPFNPEEGPTKCIAADPSLARIQFRQYREWIIQPTSKADAHRLNLEYNDAIIDFILNEIRKPGVADEIVDLKKLGLRKQLKTVEFQPTPYLIPSLSISMDRHALLSCEEEGGKGEGEEEKRSFLNSDSNNSDSSTVSSEEREEEEEEEQDEESHFRGRQGTIVNLKKNKGEDDLTNDEEQQQQQNPPSLTQITPRTAPSNERLKSKLTVFDSTFEMSKDLMEHIPLEVLKRLVMRWPVDGEENVMDQESLGFRRLLIHVWDCSGDPLQLSVVPLFFSSRSIYLMTYDVRNSINDPATSFLTHKLTNSKGSPPTNGEVLNEWLGGVLAQSKHLPSNPQPVSRISPQLPPLIFVTPFSDMSTRYSFQDFFKPSPSSPQSFLHHMIEPNFVSVSNHDETKMISEYRSHYYLRREIDYLARQMPYIYDMVPVQWVMFEQLLHSLLEQKKVIIQLTDLERYVAENCDIIGPLQVQPVLSYYNDVGRIIHFHRHPALSPLIVIRPQWLLDALGSIFNSSSTTWITNEVRNSFQCLASEGHIRRDVLLLAYRCSHLPQYFWNETLYFMNYMDLSACHTSLHETAGLYIPALVTQTPPSFAFGPTGDDPETLFFSCGKSLCPLSLFNQLVVRCIRTCRYPPVMYYGIVHLRLNSTHHLILRRDGNRVGVLVQRDTEHFCRNCPTGQTSFETTRECEHLTHLIDYEKETTPSVSGGGGGVEMDKSFLNELPNISLSLSDDLNQLEQVCPIVLKFLEETFEFLIRCWYPGLLLELTTEGGVVINQRWRKRNSTESTERTNDDRKLKKLSLWFL